MAGVLWLLLIPSFSDGIAPMGSDSSEEFVESVAPFVPRYERTESEKAKVTAAALYAHGRLLLRQGDHASALRRFQRAWRYDPQVVSLLPRIVFLAHRLGRTDEAARYALLAAERTEVSAALMRQLALQLSRRQDWDGAIGLFEKSLHVPDDEDTATEVIDLGTTIAYLEMGRLYFLAEEFDQSARCFAHIRKVLEDEERLAANPALTKVLLGQAPRTYRMLGESFFQAGRYDEAEAMIEKARASRPAGVQQEEGSEYFLARIDAKRGDRAGARKHLDAYFASQSSAVGVAALELLNELVDDSVSDELDGVSAIDQQVEELLEVDPNNPALLLYAAQRDLDAKRLERAESRLERVLVLQPGLAAYQGLIEVHRQRQNFADLLDVFAVAAARGASLRDFEELLTPVVDDEPLASELIQRAALTSTDGEDDIAPGARLACAVLSRRREDAATADRLFDLAIKEFEATSRQDWLIDWGVQLLLDARYEEAANLFRNTLAEGALTSREAACRFYLIRALALAGQIEPALAAARIGAEGNSDLPRLQAQPAWVLYHAKRYRAAEVAYTNLLQKFESLDNPEMRATLRDARLVLSNICVQLDRTAEAEEWLEQVLDEFPEDVGALNDLGYLWTEQGKNPMRALSMVQKAVQESPDNVAYRDSLGWAYYQLGRYEEAVAQLQQAASGEDPDGVILEHLGDAFAKAGKQAEAVDAWRRALKVLSGDIHKTKRKTIQQKIKDFGK